MQAMHVLSISHGQESKPPTAEEVDEPIPDLGIFWVCGAM